MKAFALSIAVFLIIFQTAFSDSDCPALYRGIKGHTACVPKSSDYVSGSVSKDDRKIILDEHNKYRAAVTPPACTMLKLYWNDDLAYVAQRWADNCKFDHDKGLQRAIPGSFVAGQNLGKGFSDWGATIDAWHSEVKDFTYNGTNDFMKVGHYTQVVWAQTALVGCGFAKCKQFTLQVCNYGPSGNQAGALNTPYEKCAKSSPLKDCNGKVCKNGGSMKQGSCDCECKKYKHIYGPECSVNCSVKDTHPCGTAFKEAQCTFTNVPPNCPWTCKTCPYLDQAAGSSAAAAFKYSVMSALPVIVLFLLIKI